jgi:hypothetical protein
VNDMVNVDVTMLGREQEIIESVIIIPPICTRWDDLIYAVKVSDEDLNEPGVDYYGIVYPNCPHRDSKTDGVGDFFCHHKKQRDSFMYCGLTDRKDCPCHAKGKPADIYDLHPFPGHPLSL